MISNYQFINVWKGKKITIFVKKPLKFSETESKKNYNFVNNFSNL